MRPNPSPSAATERPAVVSPWSLHAWPPIYWQTGQQPPVLRHVGTRITVVDEHQRPAAGQTIWAGSGSDGNTGMAWDWIQMPQGMVAMADPMCVVSNLCILSEDGEVLTAAQAAVVLNEIVYSLPWQREVQRAIRAAH